MDCLRSFSFVADSNENIIVPELNTWGVAPQNYFVSRTGFTTESTYLIEGFKNINVFKVEAVGNIDSTINSGNLALIQDWSFRIGINGNNSSNIGRVVAAPNKFSIAQAPNDLLVDLSKYNPKIELESPVQSVKSIRIIGLTTSGIGAQNLLSLNLKWSMVFVIYYKFEGE